MYNDMWSEYIFHELLSLHFSMPNSRRETNIPVMPKRFKSFHSTYIYSFAKHFLTEKSKGRGKKKKLGKSVGTRGYVCKITNNLFNGCVPINITVLTHT